MFQQLLTPVGDSLLLSFLVAAMPIACVLVLLGVLRRPAWQACIAGLLVALADRHRWSGRCRSTSRCAAVANGAVFALWPIMWIVVNALLLYNVAVASGRFEAFRDWVIDAPAERPARRARGDRLLLRRPARRASRGSARRSPSPARCSSWSASSRSRRSPSR